MMLIPIIPLILIGCLKALFDLYYTGDEGGCSSITFTSTAE